MACSVLGLLPLLAAATLGACPSPGNSTPRACAAGPADEDDVSAALQLPPRLALAEAGDEVPRPAAADGPTTHQTVNLKDVLGYIDTRSITVAGKTVMPFVFDKILVRSRALGDALVTDKERMLKAIRAVSIDDVAESNELLAALYQPDSKRKWIDISGRWTQPVGGEPGRRLRIRPPRITSKQMAFDMLVVYARSLTRDVPLTQWSTHPTTVALAKALNSIYQANKASILPLMPTVFGKIVAGNLFRGIFPHEWRGYFWNQLQMFPGQTGIQNTPQPRVYYPEQDACEQITKQGFLDQQEGRIGFQKLLRPDAGARIIGTPRDIIGFVHSDVLEVAYIQALDLLLRTDLQRQSVFDGKNPSLASATEVFYSETGCGYMKGFLVNVIRSGLVAAWNHKYAFLRIRPEKLAYFWNLLLKSGTQGAPLSVHEQELKAAFLKSGYFKEHLAILASTGGKAILKMVRERNAAHNLAQPWNLFSSTSEPYLLMPVFPEGSPTHASFVGGHSVASGAQATALKMFFNMYEDDGVTFKRWSDVIRGAYEDSFSTATIKALWADSDFIGKFYTADRAGDIRAPLRPAHGQRPRKYVVDASLSAATITVVGEIHKLASQYTHSRDWSGVHYGTDGINGMYIGQSVAIEYLQDVLRGLPSTGQGLDNSVTFPTFDGKKVRVTANSIQYNGKQVKQPEDLYPKEVRRKLVPRAFPLKE